MIQLREIMLIAKHLQKKLSQECVFQYYILKKCVSCTKYILLNSILFSKKSLCISKKKIPKILFCRATMQLHMTS